MPPGLPWFPMVMGSGLLSTILGLHAGEIRTAMGSSWLVPAAVFFWVYAAVALVLLLAGFIRRCLKDHRVFWATLNDFSIMPLWGALAMGFLSVGAATQAVLPLLNPNLLHLAVLIDAALWVIGVSLGLVTAFGFTASIIMRHPGRPLPVWGLPLVPPIVSATTGSALVPFAPTPGFQLTLIVGTVACFFISLVLGFVIFAVALHHHIRIENVPLESAISAWIPLGIVGQSMAASQSMATQAVHFVLPFAIPTIRWIANVYGLVMLAVAVPVIINAVRLTAWGLRNRMPFSPGWWALTFPVGTLTLGTKLLGASLGSPVISGLSIVLLCVLMFNWLFCAVSTVRALRASHQRAGIQADSSPAR